MHNRTYQNCKGQEGPRVSPGFSVFNLNSNSPSSSQPESYAGIPEKIDFEQLQHCWMVGLVNSVEEHQWERSDPFSYIKRFLSKELKSRPQKPDPKVFRFDEWQKIIDCIHPHHRAVAEFMIMTGTIGSEIAGLKKSAIKSDRICIENSIVRNHEKEQLKTYYRKRDIPMTKALKQLLDSVIRRSDSEYVFTTKSGLVFDVDSFRKNPWTTALKKAGIEYRVPYSTRHSFAAWCLALKMDPNKLVSLMGHGSKKMVYEVYGKYVEGLETDAGKISAYFGNDFNALSIKNASPFT